MLVRKEVTSSGSLCNKEHHSNEALHYGAIDVIKSSRYMKACIQAADALDTS